MSNNKHANGHSEETFGIEDKRRADDGGKRRPNSQLEVLHEVLAPPTGVEDLETANLGLGNLTDAQAWQQVAAMADHIYADTLSRYQLRQAKWTAIRRLGEEGWSYPTDDGRMKEIDGKSADRADTRLDYREKGRVNWQKLPDQEKLEVLDEYGGLSASWKSAFWKMLVARNEISRSRGARLVDDYFGRVSEREVRTDADAKRLGLGRGEMQQ